MKKLLIIAFAICVLSLSACSSLTGTDTSSSNSTSNAVAPIAAVSTQSSCQVLQDRQSSLNRAYQITSIQYRKARIEKNAQEAGQAKKELMSLHQSIVETQKQLKAC
jgi:peptidoglycan hydrolase CwlO-like protein